MGKLIGTDLGLFIDGSLMAFAKSFEYSITSTLTDCTTMADGGWDSFRPTNKGWSGSVDSFVMKDADSSRGHLHFQNCILNDVSIGVEFKTADQDYLKGAAWASDLKYNNSDRKEFVTFSVSLTGEGKLVPVSVP